MINSISPEGVYRKETVMSLAKVYAELEFGDPVWVIRKAYVSNQFADDYGRVVTVLDDGTSILEDEDDLVAVLPALDE